MADENLSSSPCESSEATTGWASPSGGLSRTEPAHRDTAVPCLLEAGGVRSTFQVIRLCELHHATHGELKFNTVISTCQTVGLSAPQTMQVLNGLQGLVVMDSDFTVRMSMDGPPSAISDYDSRVRLVEVSEGTLPYSWMHSSLIKCKRCRPSWRSYWSQLVSN